MTIRFIVGLVAAALFFLAGFTGFNEGSEAPHLAYLWFGLAGAAAIIAVTIPGERPTR
jgi:hypothetical protein